LFAQIANADCNVSVGKFTTIQDNVILGPKCKNIQVGAGCFIGRDIYVDVESLSIGNYTTIHHGSVLSGIKTAIGHNCWFGHYTVIDSLGGDTRIGNNVGVGAHSQLWSHIKFGDTLAGCRWNSSGGLYLDDDVWLVGHCIVGPIHARSWSMLMTGSVAVKDMEENHIYAGSPASDMTGKLGTQRIEKTYEEKLKEFEKLKNAFQLESKIDPSEFVCTSEFTDNPATTQFNLQERTYLPRWTENEHAFIKYLLYDKAKFVPCFTASEKNSP